MLSRAVVLRRMYSSAAVEPHLRIFTETSLLSLIDTSGFNFAESIFLYYRAAPGALVDAAFLRASFRRTWSMLYLVRACPNVRACYIRHTYAVRTFSHKGICGLSIP